MIRTGFIRGVAVVRSVGFVAACGVSPESEPSADESDTGRGVIKLAFDSLTVRGTGYSLAARVLEANPETQSISSTA